MRGEDRLSKAVPASMKPNRTGLWSLVPQVTSDSRRHRIGANQSAMYTLGSNRDIKQHPRRPAYS